MANKNRGLGRGLDALFSQGESVLEAAETKKSEDGSYTVQLTVYDNAGNVSQTHLTININK